MKNKAYKWHYFVEDKEKNRWGHILIGEKGEVKIMCSYLSVECKLAPPNLSALRWVYIIFKEKVKQIFDEEAFPDDTIFEEEYKPWERDPTIDQYLKKYPVGAMKDFLDICLEWAIEEYGEEKGRQHHEDCTRGIGVETFKLCSGWIPINMFWDHIAPMFAEAMEEDALKEYGGPFD